MLSLSPCSEASFLVEVSPWTSDSEMQSQRIRKGKRSRKGVPRAHAPTPNAQSEALRVLASRRVELRTALVGTAACSGHLDSRPHSRRPSVTLSPAQVVVPSSLESKLNARVAAYRHKLPTLAPLSPGVHRARATQVEANDIHQRHVDFTDEYLIGRIDMS